MTVAKLKGADGRPAVTRRILLQYTRPLAPLGVRAMSAHWSLF